MELTEQARETYEQVVALAGAEGWLPVFDEVAVIVGDRATADRVIVNAEVGQGYEHFNSADDAVKAMWGDKAESRYTAQYDFLRRWDIPYRIEMMTVNDGYSYAHRLHRNMLLRSRGSLEGIVVHVSYKPVEGGFKGYDGEVGRLISLGLEPVQECVSTYGRFTYFQHPKLPDGLYIKPRVNLRDESAPLEPLAVAEQPVKNVCPVCGHTWTSHKEAGFCLGCDAICNGPLGRITDEQIFTKEERDNGVNSN